MPLALWVMHGFDMDTKFYGIHWSPGCVSTLAFK